LEIAMTESDGQHRYASASQTRWQTAACLNQKNLADTGQVLLVLPLSCSLINRGQDLDRMAGSEVSGRNHEWMKRISMEQYRQNGNNQKLHLPIQPNLGLESETRLTVVELLNHILADEMVLSLNTRCAQWNVSGSNFMETQSLFAAQCKQLLEISEEIAERIRILGGVVIGGLKILTRYTRLPDHSGMIPNFLHLLADHETCVRSLREDARKCTEEYEDEGTFDLLVRSMRQHEKMAWILRSYIEPELPSTENQAA
jgi:starvation-inducible DNA-binding protein